MNVRQRKEDPGDSGIMNRGRSIASVEVRGAIQAAEFDVGGGGLTDDLSCHGGRRWRGGKK